MNNDVFRSMINSSRQFRDIEVYFYPGRKAGDADAERVTAIVKKFKKHVKKLVVSGFPNCHHETVLQRETFDLRLRLRIFGTKLVNHGILM